MTAPDRLPCWQDGWHAYREAARRRGAAWDPSRGIDEAEVLLSVVVPAYNEEDRLTAMLDEAVEYLEGGYQALIRELGSRSTLPAPVKSSTARNGSVSPDAHPEKQSGWEILIVSDGSTDRTVDVALRFARKLQLAWSASEPPDTRSSRRRGLPRARRGSLRVVSLESNRGKGGAVTHGMRHVRGQYVLFADADGASKFADVGKLITTCQTIADARGRAVAIGSRAHLVGSEAVVKVRPPETGGRCVLFYTHVLRILTCVGGGSFGVVQQRSFFRNLLMHGFHLFIRLLTPPATAAIRDTQCGFKLFSRPALPDIIPYMHSEGWIFDVEMLMLAEAAAIPVAEVAVGWKEVTGSKLHVLWDSLGMAWGLAVLRAAWAFGVYRRH